jgi:hypothetical protein
MRAVSASLITVAGSIIIAAAVQVNRPEGAIGGAIGLVIALIGLIAWFVAFLVDKPSGKAEGSGAGFP